MIYMYQRPNSSGTPYLFTDNINSIYVSDGDYITAITGLLSGYGVGWSCWLENTDDRFLLVYTFETVDEFKHKFPELLI